ncbi:aromatic amino acid transporter [Wohlfahrtiimonas chitiniclastica]|nr:aromatic amino acid transporter [Wohlfahrtiimonas chitiniclastica]
MRTVSMEGLAKPSSREINADSVEGQETETLVTKKLTLLEGVAMIVGTNIGAGVLAIPYASRNSGFLPLFLWLIIIGIITTITMLYVAESSLRTKAHHQLSGLARKYVGKVGSWLIFISIFANTTGALIAYMAGSGRLMNVLFGIPNQLGSILFAIPAVGILYAGLKAIGKGEKYISITMVALILVLSFSTIFNVNTKIEHLMEGRWSYMIPIIYLVVFSYSAQYIVPEIARGLAHKPKELPKAIMIGMACTFILLTTVALSVISLAGIEGVDEIATITWGKYLGAWAALIANFFALCAMLTSYWGLAGSYFTNIFDQFKLGSETHKLRRLTVLAVICVPPFILAYREMVSFGRALEFAGAVGGVILAILPIIMLKNARKNGDIQPDWQCNRLITSVSMQTIIVTLYVFAALYAVSDLLYNINLLPTPVEEMLVSLNVFIPK